MVIAISQCQTISACHHIPILQRKKNSYEKNIAQARKSDDRFGKGADRR